MPLLLFNYSTYIVHACSVNQSCMHIIGYVVVCIHTYILFSKCVCSGYLKYIILYIEHISIHHNKHVHNSYYIILYYILIV